jgi:amidase
MSSSRKSSAFVPHDLARPLKGADTGPLAGLGVAVKDMYDIEGERTGGGSPEWLAGHAPAKRHSSIVARVLAAGGDIIGKTVCDEFFFSLTGANAHYGTPVNVRALGRFPGGSSAGSAAATAAGACDMAIGSDTGGSMRVPASFCGVYGIRPTHGRIDMSGAMPMAPTFDVAGWFAACPGNFRKMGAVLLEGEAVPAEIAKLRVAQDALRLADEPVCDALLAFLARSESQIPRPEHVTIAPAGFDLWRTTFRTIQAHEIWSIYGAWMEANKPSLGPGVRERIAWAATVTDADAASARAALATAGAAIRALVPPGTVLCIPTAPSIAPRVDTSGEALEAFRTRAMSLTAIAGVAGLPQISIPAAVVEGCPVGLSFVGWAGADETLLDLAAALGPCCGS